MAHKSKTQRAKASAARQARKEKAKQLEKAGVQQKQEVAAQVEEPKRSFFKKKDENASQGTKQATESKEMAKKSAKPKDSWLKRRLAFFKNVKAELKRVTWPTKQDVIRWSIVVVVALLFFGIYVTVLDSIMTQILVGISSIPNPFA